MPPNSSLESPPRTNIWLIVISLQVNTHIDPGTLNSDTSEEREGGSACRGYLSVNIFCLSVLSGDAVNKVTTISPYNTQCDHIITSRCAVLCLCVIFYCLYEFLFSVDLRQLIRTVLLYLHLTLLSAPDTSHLTLTLLHLTPSVTCTTCIKSWPWLEAIHRL